MFWSDSDAIAHDRDITIYIIAFSVMSSLAQFVVYDCETQEFLGKDNEFTKVYDESQHLSANGAIQLAAVHRIDRYLVYALPFEDALVWSCIAS
jgi:hypothetical protein